VDQNPGLVLTLVLIAGVGSLAQAASQIDSDSDDAYADWSSENDWHIVSAVSDVYGDDYMEAASAYVTVRPGFSGTYSLGHDPDWRQSWGSVYWAGSRNHSIEVRMVGGPSDMHAPEMSRVYDNSQASGLSGYIAAAFSWLQDLFELFVPSHSPTYGD